MAEPQSSDGPLAEFVALRAEILQITQNQHQLLALHLTFTGAVLGFAVSQPSLGSLALIVPVVSYLFCIRSLSFAMEIQEIASYIREELDRRVPGGLRWEQWLAAHMGRKNHLSNVADSLSFPIASVLSLGWAFGPTFLAAQPRQAWEFGLMAIWILGAASTGHQSYELWFGYRRRARSFRESARHIVEPVPAESST